MSDRDIRSALRNLRASLFTLSDEELDELFDAVLRHRLDRYASVKTRVISPPKPFTLNGSSYIAGPDGILRKHVKGEGWVKIPKSDHPEMLELARRFGPGGRG